MKYFTSIIIIISGGPSPGRYPQREASGTIKSRYAPHIII
jgi:hypothetical protein